MEIRIQNGLDIPLAGAPKQIIRPAREIKHIAIIGDDYPDLKPTMTVQQGDLVIQGQLLFTDKKNSGVKFTAPASGTIIAINRGPKRKFESLVIRVNGDEREQYQIPNHTQPENIDTTTIRTLLVDSGLWTSLRTRPYGKVATLSAEPSSLFVTAIDTAPLAPAPDVIISADLDDFILGLRLVQRLTPKTYLCTAPQSKIPTHGLENITCCRFSGPHPAGLPSTHIHFLDPVNVNKTVWHINYQDVIAIGHLFRTRVPPRSKTVSLAGPSIKSPCLIKTIPGASIEELCRDEIIGDDVRLLSGSVLDGRHARTVHSYLGRYHQQISAIPEGNGRGFFGWLHPGQDRFSSMRLFLSGFMASKNFCLNTATWGGKRAIMPLGTYEKVMPLDIIATSLLKSLATNNTEKAKALGCLELIEEDLALCSFVCPGKNNFGPMLRNTLSRIEEEG